MFVQAYDSGGDPVASSQTASDGTYTLSGLATGSYKVGFVPSGSYVPQFYNGKATLASADPVSVTEGSTRTGIDAALATGGQISVLGELRIQRDGEAVSLPPSRKTRALAGYLAALGWAAAQPKRSVTAPARQRGKNAVKFIDDTLRPPGARRAGDSPPCPGIGAKFRPPATPEPPRAVKLPSG